MDEDIKKKVDEAWKDKISKEDGARPAGEDSALEATFGLFISGLMMEALVALGELENPATKKKDLNSPHAKFIIDTLAMLKEKTRTNLTKEEEEGLEAILYDLRMRFVSKTK